MDREQQREFVTALEELAVARGMDKLALITAFEEALQETYTKRVEPGKRTEVHIDPDRGVIEVLIIREVVEKLDEDPEISEKQISLADALELDPDVELGMEMEFPVPIESFSRIALQHAKQMLTQKMRDMERAVVFKDRKSVV